MLGFDRSKKSWETRPIADQLALRFCELSEAIQFVTLWLYIWVLMANIAIKFRPATCAKLVPLLLKNKDGWRDRASRLIKSFKAKAFGGGRLPKPPRVATLVGVISRIGPQGNCKQELLISD